MKIILEFEPAFIEQCSKMLKDIADNIIPIALYGAKWEDTEETRLVATSLKVAISLARAAPEIALYEE